MRRAVGVAVALLFISGVGAAAGYDDQGPSASSAWLNQVGRSASTTTPATTTPSTPGVPPAAEPAPSEEAGVAADSPADGTVEAVAEAPPVEAPELPLPGCPPPPRRPGTGLPGPSDPPWHPPVLVPEEELPEPLPAPEPVASLRPIEGKGMWLWKYFQSEGGDPGAIVARAQAAGLNQLWVRVGDSEDGFYAGEVLDGLVPRAHAAGLSVIGWGFPYLHDPVADAAWSAEALAWRGPHGAGLDGFSPDIETASEGVVVTPRRAAVYLGLVRQAAGQRLLVATVFRPTDAMWDGPYPFRTIGPYVDAFAAMVYWGCAEPGAMVAQAIDRLATLRPVHVIGQGWDMAEEGGRAGPPTDQETRRFLDVAQRRGAVGGSFWVWHYMDDDQWQTLTAFSWPARPRPTINWANRP